MLAYSTYSDEDLIRAIGADDLQAFNELYNRHAENLILYINAKLDDIEESKDVVQEIFVTIWTDRKNIFILNSSASYLYKIALNKSLNIFRHRKVTQQYVQSLAHFIEHHAIHPENVHTEEEKESYITEALQSLPEKMRAIFELRYYTGLTNQQVAEQLGISPHTVATQMKRALKSIRKSTPLIIFIAFLFDF